MIKEMYVVLVFSVAFAFNIGTTPDVPILQSVSLPLMIPAPMAPHALSPPPA